MESLQPMADTLYRAWESDRRKAIVVFRNPVELWGRNPSFVVIELAFCVWFLLTIKHALKYRGRYLQLWFAALLHGLVTETLSVFLPDIDSYWQSVTTVMFEYDRLPLYIVMFYPCFHYTVNVAASRLKLKWWSEPFAVALGDLVLDIPYDILGINFLWWTWHDTDPNLFDRMYNVPWTSYLFHLSFNWAFTFNLNWSRWLLTGSTDKEKMTNSYFAEFAVVIITGCLSMPLAILVWFIPFYHFFHDLHGVHTEVIIATVTALFVMMAWSGDRTNNPEARTSQTTSKASRKRPHFDEIAQAVTMICCCYILLVVWARPETHVSTGPHQTIGDCDLVTHVHTVTGMSLPKHPYLCAKNFSEPNFNFDCLDSLPPNGSSFYTICGSPLSNAMEYRLIVISASLFTLGFFYNWLYRSGPPPSRPQQKTKKN